MANTQTTPNPCAANTPRSDNDLFAELRALTTERRRERATQIVAELLSRDISRNQIAKETGMGRRTIQLLAPTTTTTKEES